MELCARRSRCWCWHGLAVNRVHLLAMNRAAEIVVSLIFVIDFRLCICADHASADRYFNEALTLEGLPVEHHGGPSFLCSDICLQQG